MKTQLKLLFAFKMKDATDILKDDVEIQICKLF